MLKHSAKFLYNVKSRYVQQQRQTNAFRNFRETEFSFSESPKVAVIDCFTSYMF